MGTSATIRAPSTPTNRRTQALVLLTLQNASVSLLTRSSLANADYSPSVAVLSTEILKATISLFMLAREGQLTSKGKGKSFGGHVQESLRELFVTGEGSGESSYGAMIQMAVPAALYSLQNTLLYTALSNLTAEIYQTTYQLKLVTTAIFSILFFRTQVSRRRWFSLFLLTLGVAIVQLESSSNSAESSPSIQHSRLALQDPKKGFGAIFLACISSGLAGAWFEKVLKTSPPSTPSISSSSTPPPKWEPPPSLWKRNLQLSIPSLVFASIGVYLSSSSSTSTRSIYDLVTLPGIFGMWRGFTPLVWFVVLNQAAGGLLVALVVKEASSIDKGFATSIAIVLSTLVSSVLKWEGPGWWFATGAGLVISSTVLYSL